jgi:hypothetical protein
MRVHSRPFTEINRIPIYSNGSSRTLTIHIHHCIDFARGSPSESSPQAGGADPIFAQVGSEPERSHPSKRRGWEGWSQSGPDSKYEPGAREILRFLHTLLWAIREIAQNGRRIDLTDFSDYEGWVKGMNSKTEKRIRGLP